MNPAPVREAGLTRLDDAIKLQQIQQYIWARYVNYETPKSPIDEDQALTFLESHYREHPMAEDAECYYYGILAYERSFAVPARQRPLLQTAFQAFQAYRAQTSPDFNWEIVDDRFEDVVQALGIDGEAGPRA